jgi:hypothetical protein
MSAFLHNPVDIHLLEVYSGFREPPLEALGPTILSPLLFGDLFSSDSLPSQRHL